MAVFAGRRGLHYTGWRMRNHSPLRREPRSLIWLLLLAACALLLFRAVRLGNAEPPPPHHGLLIYSIDVEGGQSTLLVSPTGASLLVDTGWRDGFGGAPGRDAERIQAAMKDAGITRSTRC